MPKPFVVHLVIPHPAGRVLSKGLNGETFVQLAVACNVSITAPNPSQHNEYALTSLTSAVSCEACKQTQAFENLQREQYPYLYDDPVENPPITVDQASA